MAKQSDDPITVGQQIIDKHNNSSSVDACSKQSEAEMFSLLSDKSYQQLQKTITCSMRSKKHCQLSKHQKLANRVIKGNQWLLERQKQLLNFTEYKNTLKVNISVPVVHNMDLQKLTFINILVNCPNYTSSEIKQFFEKDYQLNLLKVTNANTLLGKVLAIAQLEDDYYWLNELLRGVDKNTAKNIIPDYLTQTIPKSALSFRHAFIGELQFYMSLFDSNYHNEFFTLSSPVSRDDMQRLANDQAKIFDMLIEISESANYLKKIEQLNTNDEAVQLAKKSLKMSKEIITKYGGDWQAFEKLTSFYKDDIFYEKSYIIRANKLASIQKAVQLLNEIRTREIKQDKIIKFLNRPANYNPVTNKPFVWDKNMQQIIIKKEKCGFGEDRYLSL